MALGILAMLDAREGSSCASLRLYISLLLFAQKYVLGLLRD